MDNNCAEKIICRYSALPVCVINDQGTIIAESENITEIFPYGKLVERNIFELTSFKYQEVADAAGRKEELRYKGYEVTALLRPVFMGNGNIAVYFKDITNYENLKFAYYNEKACMAIVQVDNYDELKNATDNDRLLELDTNIDRRIRNWGGKINASITRYRSDLYFFVFQYGAYEWMMKDKFSILDDIRGVETQADFPVTLSIGIGLAGRDFKENDDFALAALDLALGRGGDQAVVKRNTSFEYYGGRAKAVEKSNKGKSRIIYYGFKALVNQSDKVMIMGHRNPDMDAFGSALGIHRIAKELKNDVYIVINEYNEALSEVYEQAKASEEYMFISSEKALSMADENTLVVLLDTHRAYFAECPELLKKSRKIVNIDHHRKAEDAICNAVLVYVEPYASSTSELVTEMLQYAGAKKTISKLEAEALLGGMTIDTNRFAVQTGVRTFEAASWLRRAGADTTSVKRFFRVDQDTFAIRAGAIANASIEDGIAVSHFNQVHTDAQVISAQTADELLTVKGVTASFVAGVDMNGQTVVSARSLGDINVQTIMEKLGGGGHLTTAGAQVEETPEEIIETIRAILKEE